MRGPWTWGRWLVLVALGAPVVACGGDDDRFGPPERVGLASEAAVASFGTLSDTTGVGVLGHIHAAALSASGRYLAVGDRSSPHLRILDREADSAWSFGPEGSGPGELRAAYAVEFLGDSLLLVLSGSHRLERFDIRGGWRGDHALDGTGLLIASVTTGCGNGIYAYGHPGRYRGLDSVPWVHELELGEETSARPLLGIPGTDFHFGWGALTGFDGTEAGVLLWDRAQMPHVGFWLPCAGGPPSTWRRWAPGDVEVETGLETREGLRGQALTLPDTLFAGAAARGATRLWARRAYRPDDGIQVTTFEVVADGDCRGLELVGRWTMHDAHPDGLLLYTADPFPSVKVVDWHWFRGHLVRLKCAP